jgi:hypothetical protein
MMAVLPMPTSSEAPFQSFGSFLLTSDPKERILRSYADPYG